LSARLVKGDGRTPERIREHYLIERELADRLRRAGSEERRSLYTAVYDELHRRVPDHPQLAQKADPGAKARDLRRQIGLVGRFLRPHYTFLEVGPGDCALAIEVAGRVREVIAVDVSREIAKGGPAPRNFTLVISDGVSIPVLPESVDLAYSNQLMEHLHPEDALEQLRNIHKALKPGGRYLCVTPNRLSGPHDVSRHFDDVATGFHLKEYTVGELVAAFKAAGFSGVRAMVGAKGLYLRTRPWPVRLLEKMMMVLPRFLGRWMARIQPFRALLYGRMLAIK